MLRKSILTTAILLSLSSMALASGDDKRPSHFEGEPSKSAEQALQHLQTYNTRIRELLAKPSLSEADSLEIHESTYTLEKALQRLKADLEKLQEVLEKLHLSSENYQQAEVRKYGPEYLALSKKIFGR